MFMEERLEKIYEILKRDNNVKVKDLSLEFNVSEGMIRKDLAKLEKMYNIKRTYGGAILERQLVHNENTTSRVINNFEGKEEIAKKAINLIEENDVIFMDISSTNYMMASLMYNLKKKITVVTNMNRIAMVFDNISNIEVILIWGSYNKNLGGTIGSKAESQIREIKIDKAFIGAGGINLEENFLSNFNYEESTTKKLIIEQSKKTYILTTNDKFYKDGSYKFCELKEIDFIITDKRVDEKILKEIEKFKVKIIF